MGFTEIGLVMETLAPIMLHIGDVVRRRAPWDGSPQQGRAYGPLLTVKRIYPRDPEAMIELSDGEFEAESDVERFELDLN